MVIAAPGAVFEALVSFTNGAQGQVVLAHDSLTITTGGAPATLALTADVSGCLAEAAALDGNQCALRITSRLKRDGSLLDENQQTLTVNESTLSINAAPIELFEVETVAISPATIPILEPGDSLQLTATALDRVGRTVAGRSLTFQQVSGGVTISSMGMVRALAAGPAAIRASMGGRNTDLSFTVNQTSVATLQLAPLDTTVLGGAVFAYRVTARSSTGAILSGQTITFASSNAPVASITTTGGIITAGNAGTATITASTPNGRIGAIVSANTTLTVLPRPVIAFNPLSLSFDTEIGQPLPLAKVVTVSNGGAGTLGTLAVDSIGSGITAILSSGLPPNTLTVRPTAALAPGMVLNTVVRIKSTTPGVANGVLNVTVVGKQPPPIIVSQTTVAFNNVPVGGLSNSANVSVTTTSGRVLTGLTTSVQYTPSAPSWLNASLLGTSTATTLSLSADAALLGVGTYVADITIASLNDPHVPATVRVTLQVVAAPRVVLSPKLITIGPLNPAMSPGPVTNVSVKSGLPTPLSGLSVQVQYLTSGQWLSASLLGTITSTTLQLTPLPANLSSGTYQARVIVSTTTPGAMPDTAMVTMTVVAPVVWAAVATGDSHTCALSSVGVAYCWGMNDAGQLGNGTTASSNVPVKVSGAATFMRISTSGNHTCALTANKAAYCWGLNDFGQVGVGTQVNVLVPTAVSGGRVFNVVQAGWRHSCGVTPSFQLFCWGNNSRGQLGDGSLALKTVPSLMPNANGPVNVYLGVDYTCYSNSDTELFCAGRNDNGQFGIGIGTQELFPVSTDLYYEGFTTGGFHGCGLSSNSGYCWGNDFWGQKGNASNESGEYPDALFGNTLYTSLSAGYGHTCGISTSNQALCWGDNASGQLGYGSIGGIATFPQNIATSMNFEEVRAGGGHTCARTTAGALYCWGENVAGQLGDGTNITNGLLQPVVSTASGVVAGMAGVQQCVVGPTACAARTPSFRSQSTRRARREPPAVPMAQRTAKPPTIPNALRPRQPPPRQ